jgi:hypothetical protein
VSRLAGLTAAAALLAAPAADAAGGLPSVRSGHRPGPDVLYEKPARAPELTNARPFRAKPILVSGATAYRRGEFLYQDFLYDSHGASGTRDPEDPFGQIEYAFSPKAGTLTYPSDPSFANDAADFVEVRVKPVRRATLFRVTLNVLHPQSAFTIALGDSEQPVAWPHAAGVSSPAERFVTVHGRTAEGLDGVRVRTDARRRQVTVRVPHAAWRPRGVVRVAAGAGLWDEEAGEYLAPAGSRTGRRPGGGEPDGARLFNVAFRGREPIPDLKSIPAGLTLFDAAAGAQLLGTWWREKAQADALAAGDVSQFHALVDLAKLRAGTRDDSDVPRRGPINRIMASHRVFGEGIDYERLCGGLSAAISDYKPCTGPLVGRLQPYALYVPRKPRPRRGWGLTLLLHSLSANYNQYTGTNHQSQLGERGRGSLVATPQGRGPDGFYRDIAEADVFEVWADVARHYRLDPGWVAASGYSMGGLGTFRMLSRWPDLFARGFSVVGAGDPDENLAGLRHTPIMTWNAAADELVQKPRYDATNAELERLGYRFSAWEFETADHLTIATNDQYAPGAEFLGEHRVVRNPAHITYVVDPETNSRRAGAVADHVYWLSGLRVAEGAERGTIDIRSEGFGRGDAEPGELQQRTGVLEGGSRGAAPYAVRERAWGAAPAARRRDRLVVEARDVARAVVDARRARVSCAPRVDLSRAPGLTLRVRCPGRGSRTYRAPR